MPSELPMPPHPFAGRDEELRTLDGLLGGSPGSAPIGLITGMGGVGKTALAVHWAHRVADRFPDGRLYIDLRGHGGGSALEPLEALTALLGSLGVPAEHVPREVDRAAARFRTRLGDRRMLIVLDNAVAADQVRHLLPGTSGSSVLVTSRHRLGDLIVRHGGTRLTLDPLHSEDARSLIARLLPERHTRDGGALAALAELCGRLPLALRIAAANLSDGRDPSGFVARLSASDRLNSLQVDGSRDAAVRAVFESSYRAIPDEARLLFRLLGLHPGADFSTEAAAALAGASVEAVEPVLDRLVAAHLVDPHLQGRYRFHDLLRLYAGERAAAELDRSERTAAAARLLGWHLHRADACRRLLFREFTVECTGEFAAEPVTAHEGGSFEPTHAEAVEWLTAESDNLVAAVRYAAEHGLHETAWLLNNALGGFMWRGMHGDDALRLGRDVLAAAAKAGDARGRAATELSLAWTLLRSNRSVEAIGHGERALHLATESDWRPGQAAANHFSAFAYANVGRLREALEHGTAALQANRELGHCFAERCNRMALGGIHFHRGELDAAIEYFRCELATVEENGERVVDAATLVNLSAAYFFRGRLDLADACLNEILDPESGRANVTPHSGHFRAVAYCDLLAGRLEAARKHAELSVSTLGDEPDSRREAAALSTLAEVRGRLGENREAVALFDRVLELTEQGSLYHRIEAVLGRSASNARLGQLDQARAGATWALAKTRRCGYRVFEGKALNLLAELDRDAGRLDEAASHAAAALEVHRETGHRAGEAEALRILGNILDAQGDWQAAHRHRLESQALYTGIGAPLPPELAALPADTP